MKVSISFRTMTIFLSLLGLFLFAASLHKLHALALHRVNRVVASNPTLLRITTDLVSDHFEIQIAEDGNGVVNQIYFLDDNDTGYDQSWNIAQLKAGVDVPIDTTFGEIRHKIMFKSADFDPQSGGHITMTFPSNILLNQEMTRTMSVQRVNGSWVCIGDQQLGNAQFHALFLKKNFMSDGIASVQVVD